ncbi:MAG: class I SAM-dependent methyltransferase, partial [Candidatus Obscuribacterales bacterium]|nr:class I SAM-dependent methyltransferase [Candidatus Obscuribacterales bacterium]
MLENIDWDERYKGDAEGRPWDTGSPAPELVEYFEHLDSPPAHVFEIGCGTGTNAIWMSKKGSSVVATDISPTAIDAALKKAKEASIEIDFKVSDILEESPAQNESIDFVFDRGVFHVIEPESRNKFARRVADLLVSQGHWLCLVGNADEIRGPEVIGPPQLMAS